MTIKTLFIYIVCRDSFGLKLSNVSDSTVPAGSKFQYLLVCGKNLNMCSMTLEIIDVKETGR